MLILSIALGGLAALFAILFVLQRTARLRAQDEARHLGETVQDLRARLIAWEAAGKEHLELRLKLAKLEETLEAERQKPALIASAKDQFKAVAEDILAKHGETVTKRNQEQIGGLLTPLREKLAEFQQGLQTAHTESAKDRATLGEQIRQLAETGAKMTSETHNLTRALKGKSQTQGAWGEMVLASILERCGLRDGEEYVTQHSHTTEDGNRLRPDVIVNLPGGEKIVVDSKVSLTAFEAYVNADGEAERTAALTRHVASMRAHVKELGAKAYHRTAADGLDFVILFVPIEGALAAALQADPALTAAAAEANVAIASPTTLMMALKTVASLWQVERRNRNAEEIADRAGKLYDKFVGFVGDMQTIGERIDKARGAWDDAMNKLATGKGNLVRQAETIKGMGAKAAKTLPAELLDDDRALPAPEKS